MFKYFKILLKIYFKINRLKLNAEKIFYIKIKKSL
jgi:hypothetical protein